MTYERVKIARHRSQHRAKILAAFADIPLTIIDARRKAKTFPRDNDNPDSILLHNSIDGLNQTLLRVLPELIKLLNPDTISKTHLMEGCIYGQALTKNSSFQGDQQSQGRQDR